MTKRDGKGKLLEDPRSSIRAGWQGGVLLRNEIMFYATQVTPPLIRPFEEHCLKPASYHLRLGRECRVNGQDRPLSDQNPKLMIPPHQLAVVSTLEQLNIPGFLVGRWNLKVRKVYEGLVWVGGPQVDPGYDGHLYCPLYNLSTRTVELTFKEPLFTIDFVRTTPYGERCAMWERGDKPDSLGAYDVYRLESGPSQSLKDVDDRIKQAEDTIKQVREKIDTFQYVIVTALAVLITAVTVLAAFGTSGSQLLPQPGTGVSLFLSGFAVFLSLMVALFCALRHCSGID